MEREKTGDETLTSSPTDGVAAAFSANSAQFLYSTHLTLPLIPLDCRVQRVRRLISLPFFSLELETHLLQFHRNITQYHTDFL